MNFKNPFSHNRAEYMPELWKYYVPNNRISFESLKPLIIEGGRGTGKTTLFMCNSWRAKCDQDKNEGGNGINVILSEKIVGIYYKVDQVFVGAMDKDYLEDSRERLFDTYFAIEVLKEILAFIKQLEKCGKLSYEEKQMISSRFNISIWGEDNRDREIDELCADCEKALDIIEDKLNCASSVRESKLRYTTIGTCVVQMLSTILDFPNLNGVTFKVYVDEFESLAEWQQRRINTLIKKSDHKVVYSIGVRTKGIKTNKTIVEDEVIQKTHDYQYFCLDSIIAPGYESMLKEICRKRLQLFSIENNVELPSDDIEYYLGKYSMDKELERYNNSKSRPRFFEKLKALILEETSDANVLNDLCDSADAFHARLHLCILLRKKYKPTVTVLHKCYKDYISGVENDNSKRYREWEHNVKEGVIFLLARDFSLHKLYYGFDTFAYLSSGIVRFFLELCEQAFSLAAQEDEKWNYDGPISVEKQTRAANYVSRKQIMELETYANIGKQMIVFTSALGKLFQELHRNENLTLGEPEPNHFAIVSPTSMDQPTEEGLAYAIKCSVLHEVPTTKEKDVIYTNTNDYCLNRIFAPYFEISYRKQRKIKLRVQTLADLFSQDDVKAENAVRQYLQNYWKNKTVHGVFDDGEQLSLFDPKGDSILE